MVKKNDECESTANISRQAAVWWLLLHEGRPLSLSEAWQFILWLMRSRRHRSEFRHICRLDDGLTRAMHSVSHKSRVEPDRSNVTHVNWQRGSSLKLKEAPVRRHIVRWGVAASILVLLPTVFFLARTSNVETPDGMIATSANEAKTQWLDDGSMVLLEADAALRVEFTDKHRDVHLLQGKATFDVERDPQRPFVVSTSLVDIVTFESKFVVTIDASVEVTVHEGVVRVSERGAKEGAPVFAVKAGETYRVPMERFRAIMAKGGDSSRAVVTDG